MSEAQSPEQQPAAHAGDNEISDESLEAVSGGLSLYAGNPGVVLPVTPVKPKWQPTPGDPSIKTEQ